MDKAEFHMLGRFLTECVERSEGGIVHIWFGPKRGSYRGRRGHVMTRENVWHVMTAYLGSQHTVVNSRLANALGETVNEMASHHITAMPLPIL